MKKRKKSFVRGRKTGNADLPTAGFVQEMAKLFDSGELEQCERQAQEAIRRWPEHPVGWKALANLRIRQGRVGEALEPLIKSVQIAPEDPQVLNNLGSVFLELKRYAEAEKRFREALALDPDYVQALNNLAVCLLERGRPEEAAPFCRKAVALSPNFFEAHNNLGNIHKELGLTAEAEEDYRQAILFNPDFPQAHYNLGTVQLENGQMGKAKASFRQALQIKPDYIEALCGLGNILSKQGRFSRALARYEKCLDFDPRCVTALEGLNRLRSQQVPLWHVPMMNDAPRNDAYKAALANAVDHETEVLEIGTGAGLLAMMAARQGANRVTTCEAVPEIAEMAQTIIADNGFDAKVNVIPKLSTRLEIGTDMDRRADVLVSEILSSEFLGEGVLSSIEDAKRRLLKPGGRIIPARGSIRIALCGGEDIERIVRVGEVDGFDLGRFNDIVPRKQYINRGWLDFELLTDECSVFAFDFEGTDRFPAHEEKKLEVVVRKGGRCCGIVQWIRLEMDDRVVFENHPAGTNPASGWQLCLYVLPEVVEVQPGRIAGIRAIHDRNTPWFFFEGLAGGSAEAERGD